jgi:ABC-type amino acid transport substrate-binding protein
MRAISIIKHILLVIFLFSGTSFSEAQENRVPEKIKVTVLESPPFVMRAEQGFTGFAIDLWEECAKRSGIAYEYIEASNLKDLLVSISSGASDVAVTELTINGERMEHMDFSQPWFDAGLQIMVHKPPVVGLVYFMQQLYENGYLKTYFWIAISVIIASVFLTILDRRLDPEFPADWTKGVAESFYHVVSILMTGTTNHKPLFGSYGRILAALWLVMGVGVVAYVTSSITSVMTINSMERRLWQADKAKIEDLPDLKGKTVAALEGSVASMYLTKENLSSRLFENIEQMIAALSESQVDAIVADEPSLTYYLHQHPGAPVTPVGKIIRHEKYGFALKSGSSLRINLSKQVMIAWETGYIQKLRKKYFGDS